MSYGKPHTALSSLNFATKEISALYSRKRKDYPKQKYSKS
jgi:hypothetical protein